MQGEERTNEEYRQLIDGMNDAVFIIDLKGKFLAVNDTAVDRLGYSRETLLSMRLQDIDASRYAPPPNAYGILKQMKRSCLNPYM